VTLSLLVDEASAAPVLEYAARRFVEQLAALPGVTLDQIWILAGARPRVPLLSRAWNAFDVRWAGVPLGAGVAARAAPTAAIRIGSLDELPRSGASEFIFVFSSHPDALAQCAASAARGAFELRHDGTPLAAIPDFAWSEVLRRAPVVGVELRLQGVVGEASFGPWEFRTHRASPAATAKDLIDGCSVLFEYAMRAFSSPTGLVPARPRDRSSSRRSDNRRALALWRQFVLRKVSGRIRHAWVKNQQWGIGLIPEPLDPAEVSQLPACTRWLEPHPDFFWADPFLVEEHGRTFLLFEELPFASWHGYLCAAELSSAEATRFSPRKILEKPFHLSFPFCFRYENEVYLLPEQSASGRVQAYHARHFPDDWEDGPVLLPDFPGIDNVLFEQDGLWWLVTTSARGGNQDNHLLLFFAEGPFGPYTPHPKNPVRVGLVGSRMAGPILKTGGKLVRPGQNCSRIYGGSLVFFEIEVLDVTEYRERWIQETLPHPRSRFPDAVHTWSPGGGRYVAVDGMRNLPRIGQILPGYSTRPCHTPPPKVVK
jgi:hypothetical protein